MSNFKKRIKLTISAIETDDKLFDFAKQNNIKNMDELESLAAENKIMLNEYFKDRPDSKRRFEIYFRMKSKEQENER